MADGKRLSNAGKAVTPKPGGQTMGELDTALAKAVGARVRITTSTPNLSIEGVLYAACSLTNTIAVNTAPAPPNPSSSIAGQPGDYHIIPVAQIQNAQVLSLANEADGAHGGFAGATPNIARLDLDMLKRREDEAIRKAKEREALRKKGVTKEAQEIFDHLSRQLPTRWHETSIVVNDAVMISAPYGLDNCAAPKDKQTSLTRVHKILEGFYARRRPQGGTPANSAGRPVVATPLGPRKGG